MSVTAGTVAEVVRSAMKDAGISQRELADRTGLPLATLLRRLSGQARSFTVGELFAIAEAVDVPLVEFMVKASS